MDTKAIIIYGPPGSGKGTQANRLAEDLGFVHFDTGKYVDKLVHDPAHKDDPVIQHERMLFDTGKLMTPEFILKRVVVDETKKIVNRGQGVIYSGSPRTLYEAFGDESTEGLIAHLNTWYGPHNVHVFYITVSPETSIARNSARSSRKIDDPEVIKVRLVEYANRTKPIVDELKKQGIPVHDIDGEADIDTVYNNIVRQFE